MKLGFAFFKTIVVIIIVFLIIVSSVTYYYVKKLNTKIIRDSAYQYMDVVETRIIKEMLQQSIFGFNGVYKISEDGSVANFKMKKYNSTLPTGGYLDIQNNKVINACLTIDNHKVEVENSKVTNITKGKCESED